MAKHGLTLTNVLDRAWKNPFTTKSDFAREAADIVAMAASEGYITTRIAAGHYGNQWVISPLGLRHLYAVRGI